MSAVHRFETKRPSARSGPGESTEEHGSPDPAPRSHRQAVEEGQPGRSRDDEDRSEEGDQDVLDHVDEEVVVGPVVDGRHRPRRGGRRARRRRAAHGAGGWLVRSVMERRRRWARPISCTSTMTATTIEEGIEAPVVDDVIHRADPSLARDASQGSAPRLRRRAERDRYPGCLRAGPAGARRGQYEHAQCAPSPAEHVDRWGIHGRRVAGKGEPRRSGGRRWQAGPGSAARSHLEDGSCGVRTAERGPRPAHPSRRRWPGPSPPSAREGGPTRPRRTHPRPRRPRALDAGPPTVASKVVDPAGRLQPQDPVAALRDRRAGRVPQVPLPVVLAEGPTRPPCCSRWRQVEHRPPRTSRRRSPRQRRKARPCGARRPRPGAPRNRGSWPRTMTVRPCVTASPSWRAGRLNRQSVGQLGQGARKEDRRPGGPSVGARGQRGERSRSVGSACRAASKARSRPPCRGPPLSATPGGVTSDHLSRSRRRGRTIPRTCCRSFTDSPMGTTTQVPGGVETRVWKGERGAASPGGWWWPVS